ncbi:hypothetical protein QVD17_04740 [Tagetes erecta]|uniref:DUF4378 domain-containing protein n=1 Tax=Tagetes erecta TaxID=13708 RepID=A0AAD8LIC6_TARER|nr:hypothetical protein QVD17_04740 [Tagetes erecta]
MSTEVMHTLEEDKQELQKQLGCMNGFFQLFDRRYLLGQRRHCHHHKKLPQGQGNNSKEFNNASEKKPKERNVNNAVKEKHRVSVESSRNSFSSSCSSLDCSKRVQTESSSFCPSIVSEPSSPTSNKKHDSVVPPADIRDVVKDSMTRKPRVVSVKTVVKDGRKGPTMTHVDSPRPLVQHPKPVPYERKDQNLAKLHDISIMTSRGVKEVKDTSRYSYDGRESPYKLKSVSNIKDRPRFSLDSKQSSLRNRTHVVDQSQNPEPGSNKKPPSSLVAKLMGLEVLKCESLKIKPCLDEESFSVSRLSRKPVSPRVNNALTRIPLELAPWKQEVKQPVNKKARDGCQSVYGQIEKRLTEVEFKTSGKDLRALKQILEAIQRTKMRLENTCPHNSVTKPADVTSDSMVLTNRQKVEKVNLGRGRARSPKPTEKKSTGRTKKAVSPSPTTEYVNRESNCNSRNSETVSPRLQKSKIKKQSNGKLSVSNSKTRDQSRRESCKINHLSEQGDTSSFPSESDASVASQNETEVMSSDWIHEHKNKIAERLMGYKPTAEQPSPVSVLDSFYTEDTPSPIKKIYYPFKDGEELCFDEQEWSQMGINNLVSSTELNQLSPRFSNTKFENIKQLVHQIKILDSTNDEATVNPHEDINEDHMYIKEILLASGFLKNLDCATTIAHLYPMGSLINPELFNILEKTKECTSKPKKMKRKMIFDTMNNILAQKLARSASSGLWTSKRKAEIMNGEKLLEELWLEINNLLTNKASDPYDEVMNIISENVNKNSEDWDHKCYELPALVLDIERLIFKDLISEIVNAEVSGQQQWHGSHRRQLFLI